MFRGFTEGGLLPPQVITGDVRILRGSDEELCSLIETHGPICLSRLEELVKQLVACSIGIFAMQEDWCWCPPDNSPFWALIRDGVQPMWAVQVRLAIAPA